MGAPKRESVNRRSSREAASAWANPASMPDRTPKSTNATAIESSVSIVRVGLRHSPAPRRGRYFTRSPRLRSFGTYGGMLARNRQRQLVRSKGGSLARTQRNRNGPGLSLRGHLLWRANRRSELRFYAEGESAANRVVVIGCRADGVG